MNWEEQRVFFFPPFGTFIQIKIYLNPAERINIFSSNQNFCNKLSSNLHFKMGIFSNLNKRLKLAFVLSLHDE